MPIPTASIIAATAPTPLPPASAPNATPTAIPSGILWIVTAAHITAHLRFLVLSENMFSFSVTISVTIIRNPPSTNPEVSTSHARFTPVSSAGIKSEKNVEASIIPAALLIINENAPLPTLLQKKTGNAPRAVKAQVNVVAISACCQPYKL